MFSMYIGITLVTSHVNSLPIMFFVGADEALFNYPVLAHINHMSMGPCEAQKGRQDENAFHLSRTKLIIQLLFSEWLCCPDNFGAIYNRLPCQDNKRASCRIITLHGKPSTQNSWDCQKTPETSENPSAYFIFSLRETDDKVMSKNTLKKKKMLRNWK